MRYIFIALTLIASPVRAEPMIDVNTSVNVNDGYCQWITIDGTRPIDVSNSDVLRYRSFTGFASPDEWLAMTFRWNSARAIRLRCGHPLYQRLTRPAPVTDPRVPALEAENAALKAKIAAAARALQ